MTTPSFELSPDHLELQQWIHRFAADLIRPAAAEWDEREEFPWPVLEELFWGDAGIGLAIVGTTLAAASVRANGTDEQVGEWVPQMFGSR